MRKKEVREWEIAVLGAGTMGTSVAQFFATHGHRVFLYNRTAKNLDNAITQIENNLTTMASIGEVSKDEIPLILGRICGCNDLDHALASADFVIENLAEQEDVKKLIFTQMDDCCGDDVIFSSDTSTMNIYDFVSVSHPERLIITHFFNPAHVMPLVEIVRGPRTSDETVALAKELLESSGKTTAVLNRAIPGFILNRITMAVFREASYIVENGWASPEDIDKAITSTFGPRYAFEGPFALSDFGGLDIYERLATLLFPELSADKACPEFLKEMLSSGKLGVKSGEGFYHYEDPTQAHGDRDTRIMYMIQAIREMNEKLKKEKP